MKTIKYSYKQINQTGYVYFDVVPPITLADYIKGLYTSDGTNGLYYHDGSGSYTNADQEAGDNSYRYAGASADVNNYVCFGSNAETCPNDNLYRIIGVFDENVKLIKATIYGTHAWDINSNVWDETTKPDIYTEFNTTYYNSLSSEWQEKIASYKWHVGGIGSEGSFPKNLYNSEVGIYQTGFIETMKIGLMYISDYAYATSPALWNVHLGEIFNRSYYNWLYLSDYEWFITRESSNTSRVYYIYSYDGGRVSSDSAGFSRVVRPTFYLNTDVAYISGIGTQTDPIRLSIA